MSMSSPAARATPR